MSHNRPDTVQKKSIVWFWHHKSKEWRRGKVIAVNRWGLVIRAKSKLHFASYYERVVLASDPKPSNKPPTVTEWLRGLRA